jgi:hypothetical protein
MEILNGPVFFFGTSASARENKFMNWNTAELGIGYPEGGSDVDFADSYSKKRIASPIYIY